MAGKIARFHWNSILETIVEFHELDVVHFEVEFFALLPERCEALSVNWLYNEIENVSLLIQFKKLKIGGWDEVNYPKVGELFQSIVRNGAGKLEELTIPNRSRGAEIDANALNVTPLLNYSASSNWCRFYLLRICRGAAIVTLEELNYSLHFCPDNLTDIVATLFGKILPNMNVVMLAMPVARSHLVQELSQREPEEYFSTIQNFLDQISQT